MIPREMFGLFQCFPKGKLSFVRNLFAFDRIHGFFPTFGDIPLWHILASSVLLLYISSYPCVTALLWWGHGRSVAPETASMEEGARFRLDTSHHRPGPLVTRCDCAAPRGVRSR